MNTIIKKTLFVVLFFFQTTYSQQLVNKQPVATELAQLATEFVADYGSLSRFYVIKNTPERRNRFKTFYNNYFSKLNTIPFSNLSVGGKVDYLLIKRHIDNKLFALEKEEKEYNLLKQWIAFGEPIYQLEKQRRRGKRMNGLKVANQLYAVKEKLEANMLKLKDNQITFPINLTQRAEKIIKGQRKALKSVYEFYNGYDPQFTWWVEKPYKMLDGLLNTYSKLIKLQVDATTLPKDDGSGIIGSPIGRKEIIRQLKTEMIPYSPEELVEIALKEFAWCEVELLKASNEMGFGNNWKQAQEKVKQTYVEVGYQPEKMYELYKESVAFLKSKNLLTIPPLAEETWRMKMLSPKRQLIAPFFLGGETLQIAYPTNTMNHDDKLMSLRGNNPHFARAVVHHELIAGHHLQGFMNKRHKTYRFYGTPFWIEGWALYWEMILWDEGFAKLPEDRIGMLFWRMHRCARIIFSLNYHLKKWSPQQCIDYLVDKVGHERSTAKGEVRRSFTGNYGPLYQIAYMVGGLQFYELKNEFVNSGKMSYKEFHDAILRENNMPVEMLRALLLNDATAIKKDFKSSWKFYKK